MMTRKHFAAIAAAIGPAPTPMGEYDTHNTAWEEGYKAAQRDIARALAVVCARENPNFDRASFLAACGVDQ